MQAFATWKGGFETILEDDRAHSVVVDLPADEGGRSTGPSALDLTLMSLAGCISTYFLLIGRKRHLEFQGMSVALEAERGKAPHTFSRIRGSVRVHTRAESSDVETVVRLALSTCPVGALFDEARVPVDVSTVVVSPSTSR